MAKRLSSQILGFVEGGHPVFEYKTQVVRLSTFLDVMQECIEVGAIKLGLIHSKIIDGEVWLKQSDGSYLVVNPTDQTIISASSSMEKSNKNIGLYMDQIIEITNTFSNLLAKVK